MSTAEPGPAPAKDDRQRFPFEFDARLAMLALPFGVIPSTAYVDVDHARLLIRFGHWSLRAELTNVAEVTPTGPYRWWKVAGPPRLSFADRPRCRDLAFREPKSVT
jgi:hypothetical protein